MRTIMIILVAVAILGVVCWAIIPNVGAHISAKGQGAADWLNKKATLEELNYIAEREVVKCRDKIREYHVNISKCRIKADLVAEEIEDCKERLAGKEAILKNIGSVLAQHKPGDTVTVNSKPYTWEQVNQDALLRIDSCKALNTEIKEKTNLLNGLSMQVEEAETQLGEATSKVNQLTGKIKEWEAKIAAKQVEVQVTELVDAIKGDPLGSHSGVTAAMNALQDRYLELESRVAVSRETAIGRTHGAIVPWESEVAPRQAVGAIQSYFSRQAVGPPQPVAEPETVELVIPSVDVNN